MSWIKSGRSISLSGAEGHTESQTVCVALLSIMEKKLSVHYMCAAFYINFTLRTGGLPILCKV